MNKSSEIFTLAEFVPEGCTERFVCPFCDGGSGRETSLAITRFDSITVKWFCHRASCGARGESFAPGLPNRSLRRAAPSFPDWSSVTPLNEDSALPYVLRYYKDRLGDNWENKLVVHEVMVGFEDPQLVQFKLRDYNGEGLGYQHQHWRAPGKKDSRVYKTLYPNRPIYGAYGFRGPIPAQVWLVEDCLSAIKLAECGAASVSLLGTNIPRELITRLVSSFGKELDIFICLDWDAAEKSVESARDLRQNLGCRVTPVFLRKDFKDLPESGILDILADYSPENRLWDLA